MNPKAKTFLDRLARSGASVSQQLSADVEHAFGIPTHFEAKAREIRNNARLSVQGQNEEIGRALKNGPVQHLSQLRAKVSEQLEIVKRNRAAALQPRKLGAEDRNDVVSELQRQEVRTWLRGLSQSDRVRAILETKDPMVCDAALLAPRELSGLAEDHRTALLEKIAEKTHGPRLEVWARDQDALEVAAIAIDEAERDLHRIAALDLDEMR